MVVSIVNTSSANNVIPNKNNNHRKSLSLSAKPHPSNFSKPLGFPSTDSRPPINKFSQSLEEDEERITNSPLSMGDDDNDDDGGMLGVRQVDRERLGKLIRFEFEVDGEESEGDVDGMGMGGQERWAQGMMDGGEWFLFWDFPRVVDEEKCLALVLVGIRWAIQDAC
jgi:hypothetical protein